MPGRRRSTKAAAPVVEDLEDEVLENDEDMDELDDEPQPAPKRRGRPAKSAPVAEKPARKTRKPAVDDDEEKATSYGTSWLVEYVNDQLDTEFDAKALRVLLRKATEAGILDRDDNSRYQFTGESDRKVAKILKFVREAQREEAAAEPKAKAAPAKRKRAVADEEDEAPARPARKRGRPAKKSAPVEDDDMPDFDEDEIDEL